MPDVLLLTWCSPASRFAGGEALRRLIGALPPGQVAWCPVGGGQRTEDRRQRTEVGGRRSGNSRTAEQQNIEPQPAEGGEWGIRAQRLHWRLRGGVIERFLRQTVWAQRAARAIVAQIRQGKNRPRCIWLLAELDAVPVAGAIQRLTGIPVHATVHDAWELAAHSGVPSVLMPLYNSQVRRVLGGCQSVDAVSDALLDYVDQKAPAFATRTRLVVPPSIPSAWMCGVVPPLRNGHCARIGLCGTHRISRQQWRAFTDLLGRVPRPIELVVFGNLPHRSYTPLPANVSVATHEYLPTEQAMIRALHEHGVTAGYVGLRTEPGHELFARTSLSSKLVAYTAAGVPLIVDAPEDSVAWRLVCDYQAGVLLHTRVPDRAERLRGLLCDPGRQQRMATGAARMCEREFTLERNVVPLMRALGLEDVRREA